MDYNQQQNGYMAPQSALRRVRSAAMTVGGVMAGVLFFCFIGPHGAGLLSFALAAGIGAAGATAGYLTARSRALNDDWHGLKRVTGVAYKALMVAAPLTAFGLMVAAPGLLTGVGIAATLALAAFIGVTHLANPLSDSNKTTGPSRPPLSL